MFPPGTVRLEDATAPAGEGIILQPRPSEDPNDPLNWSTWRKYLNFGLASLYVLMVSEFINSATPTWGPMHTELGFSYEILNDSYAVGSAFLAIGALVLVPFALKFGRRPLYLFSTLVLFAVSIWSAKLQTVADLMLVNVFCTAFGALAEVIVQMTIADVFFVHQRGKMNSIYIWLWQVSVSLGPLIAGFITTGQGWRWVWWWNAVFFGFCSILVAFGYEETKYCPPSFPAATPVEDSTAAHDEPEVDVKPACNLKQDLPEPGCAKVAEEGSLRQDIYAVRINHNIPMKTYAEKLALSTPSSSGQGLKGFLRHMYQPLVLLTTIPAVAYTALVYGILVATQDVMSTTFSTYMTEPPYKFNASQIGLMNLPKLAGVTIGSLVAGPVSDVMILCLARRNNGIYEPEQRLWSIIPFIAFIPAGALMFGIGLNNGLPWPVIAVGLFLYKLGIAPINSLTITYLTDSYKDIIGDALVGVTVVRNTFSTVFIFAITPWIAAIGIKWVIIIIVLISVVFLSFTGVLIVYGKTFRARTATRYAYYASLQYKER
ncbi:major facilitator superfamily domain-containing protein [Pseudomassariella vexata]|uniref:Major facilitator superfamily domain-containing protein n=1 Tax=Pseudomassariella vexata TaxID=1141098 RepID=A0A1Y2DCZ3_9PEZI|nr:major facilitator superfamily domain-containing protein [Pseudomassariella vexata]ORY56986.1 major facilitator superfamily domain-containing protein [Pseudomassariella vexata]